MEEQSVIHIFIEEDGERQRGQPSAQRQEQRFAEDHAEDPAFARAHRAQGADIPALLHDGDQHDDHHHHHRRENRRVGDQMEERLLHRHHFPRVVGNILLVGRLKQGIRRANGGLDSFDRIHAERCEDHGRNAAGAVEQLLGGGERHDHRAVVERGRPRQDADHGEFLLQDADRIPGPGGKAAPLRPVMIGGI